VGEPKQKKQSGQADRQLEKRLALGATRFHCGSPPSKSLDFHVIDVASPP